jgi:hypothetical protein
VVTFPSPTTTPSPPQSLQTTRLPTHLTAVAVLGEVGVLALDGDRDVVEAVVLAMAWDLAAAPWATRTQITLVGAGKTSAERHPDRFRYARGWDEAIDSLEPEPDQPHVLLSVLPLSDDVARRLLPLGIDAVVAAHGEDVVLPGAWHLDVGKQGTAVEALGEEVRLQKLTPAQVDELVAALADADEPVEVPADDYRNVPLKEGAAEPVQAHAPMGVLYPRRCRRSRSWAQSACTELTRKPWRARSSTA